MKPSTAKSLFFLYCLWIAVLVSAAIYGDFFKNQAEYGVASHLWLIISGLPSSLLSLTLPSGSLSAVLVAATLSWFQWGVVYYVITRKKK
jgi:hypothetical protein